MKPTKQERNSAPSLREIETAIEYFSSYVCDDADDIKEEVTALAALKFAQKMMEPSDGMIKVEREFGSILEIIEQAWQEASDD